MRANNNITSPLLQQTAMLPRVGVTYIVPRQNPPTLRCGLSSMYCDHLLNFGTPSIYLEWVKVDTSYFVHR